MRLFKISLFLILVFAVAGASQAQFVLGVQAGYGNSAFKDQESAAGSIPVGVIFGTTILPIFGPTSILSCFFI